MISCNPSVLEIPDITTFTVSATFIVPGNKDCIWIWWIWWIWTLGGYKLLATSHSGFLSMEENSRMVCIEITLKFHKGCFCPTVWSWYPQSGRGKEHHQGIVILYAYFIVHVFMKDKVVQWIVLELLLSSLAMKLLDSLEQVTIILSYTPFCKTQEI